MSFSGKPQGSISSQKLFNARKGEAIPWIVNPLEGLRGKEFKSFHVRHEASMIELFFDLFFVANLATFTTYHEITKSADLRYYVGFFVILWSTWFQIMIFDVRFAADSVFERICKLYQFIFFTMLAVIGFTFAPGGEESKKAYRIYQTLAIVMGLSRFFLATQYAVVALFVTRKHKKLIVPFSMIVLTMLVSGGLLLMTFKWFNRTTVSSIHRVWWIVLPLESVTILLISSFWRILSFKESHLAERLSLLTMIIIGEGVIGSTKTAGALWPTTSSPIAGGIIAMISIIVMLLLMWQLYFDNHPHGHYGTIKQQWWALSHFFLHIGFVGIVEGSNRMAIFYNAIFKQVKFYVQIDDLCYKNTTATTAKDFVKSINYTVEKLKIDYYDPRSYDNIQYYLNYTLYGKQDGSNEYPYFCNFDNPNSDSSLIQEYMFKGIYKRFNIDPPEDTKYGDSAFYHTFKVTFSYLWGAVALSMIMLLIFLWIVRTKKRDVLEVIRLVWRFLVALVAIGIACLTFNDDAFITVISSPWVVTAICALMISCVLFDRIIRLIGVWKFKRHYAIPPPEAGHGHGDEHDVLHSHASPRPGMTPQDSYKMEPQVTVSSFGASTGYTGVPQTAPEGYSNSYPIAPQSHGQSIGYGGH